MTSAAAYRSSWLHARLQVRSELDARFLALIDDLVEMHPRRHPNRPLRARPRGYDPIIIDAEFVLDDLLRKAAP